MMRTIKSTLLICLLTVNLDTAFCLENGLARTPPMGWLAWEQFGCNTNCTYDPMNCISEHLFMEMADKLIHDGYKDAGYQYVNIDDCWMSPYRDAEGSMVADPVRFPRGIKFLADYMHNRGLKLGIYQDFGSKTCMGYPGIVGHMNQDADAFANWEVDMVKLDGCHSHPLDMDDGYIKFGHLLNNTKRPMLYSCSWPYYQLMMKMEPNYKLIASHCNMWRNFHDINGRWGRIELIIDFFGDNQEVIAPHIAPGHWADPDMLLIGSSLLNPGQARIQMAVWCVIPAPLLMSNDLRYMNPLFKHILLNKLAISINQDRLGIPGKRIYKKDLLDIWIRQLSSPLEDKYSYVILLINTGKKEKIVEKIVLKDLGLGSEKHYMIVDVFRDVNYGIVQSAKSIKVYVPATDVVMLHCKLFEK